jgi:ATP-dependent Clp protease ATP-binding subunit ClpB
MNLNKLTEKAQEAILGSQNLATEQNHSEVTPEHLLVTLVEQSGGIVPSLVRKMSLDPARVAAEVRALLTSIPQAYGGDVRLSPRMKLIVDSAQAEATSSSVPNTCSSRWRPKRAAPPQRSCCSDWA